MCGIVTYFGGAGNNLTRVLTAMSAIVYRAPDSTGVGLFGDDLEPIRARKSIGSVSRLIEAMFHDGAYPNPYSELLNLWDNGNAEATAAQRQRALLTWEGFSPDVYEKFFSGEKAPTWFDTLVDLAPEVSAIMEPGTPGRTGQLPCFHIRSRKDLKALLQKLITEYDLSPVLIQVLIRERLQTELTLRQTDGGLNLPREELLAAFDQLLERVLWEERLPRPSRLEYGVVPRNPYAQKYLWRLLTEIPIQVPADYDRDGVRCVFRLLDAALVCRLRSQPELAEVLECTLRRLWPGVDSYPAVRWKVLYETEKRANVYGWAAAAALAHLQQTELPAQSRSSLPSAVDAGDSRQPGRTNRLDLRFLATPIIAHGRWANQSPVTVNNAHPFLDETMERAVVLNGQFNGEVESELREFLRQENCPIRSENSTEFLAHLWGHYFKVFAAEKTRYQAIRSHIKANLESYSVGSQVIDHRVFQQVYDKSAADLDEMAFLEAIRQLIRNGGQLTAAGMSLRSPQRLYVASHNRPVFVVRRIENDDFMVVSDINAAMGLFPQALIYEKSRALRDCYKRHRTEINRLKSCGATPYEIDAVKDRLLDEENEILQAFRVEVYTLEGEEILARIETRMEAGQVMRQMEISHFDGSPMPDVEPVEALLNPVQTRKDLFHSFFETHLHEIPERLTDIFRTYLPEGTATPQLKIRERHLAHRFGRGFEALQRIVLVGMGSAYSAALMGRALLQDLLPQLEVVVLRPVEVEHVQRVVDPEKDLVVLLSWSGTTADMVDFAKELAAMHVTMIGISEKRFSDMAHVVQRSGGIILTLSGEEVTVSAIKSTLCMLYCLDLLAVWLEARLPGNGRGTEETRGAAYLDELARLPELLAELLADEGVRNFSRQLAQSSGGSRACFVLDALHTVGTGHEVALKLEENSWVAIAKPLDYRELFVNGLKTDLAGNLVLVNATHQARREEALDVMKKLALAHIPFAAVHADTDNERDIQYYSDGLCLNLPKVFDSLQPFVDLIFYYLFAFDYGMAHGRKMEDFPRNRVKSVTASRGRPKLIPSPPVELLTLEKECRFLPPAPAAESFSTSPTAWEAAAFFDWEKTCYRQMHRLAAILSGEQPLQALLQNGTPPVQALSHALFGENSEDLNFIFVCLDRKARGAATIVAGQWARLLGRWIRVATIDEIPTHYGEEFVLFFIAANAPEPHVLKQIADRWSVSPALWLGPALPSQWEQRFSASLGYCVLSEDLPAVTSNQIYSSLHLIFTQAWRKVRPDKAAVIDNLLHCSPHVVAAVLNDHHLRDGITAMMAGNQNYTTAFFVGPAWGSGLAWVDRFERLGALAMEWHPYGESAHGPLVTVDPRVEEKFISLHARQKMVSLYGEVRVSGWEQQYLAGKDLDEFLNHPLAGHFQHPNGPFYAEGHWYLPVLQPDYDTSQDNLIVLDATLERHFDQALDELATYGCRYAQLVTITQQTFRNAPDKKGLFQYSPCPPLYLPALGTPDSPRPIPELLLPLAMNLVGVGLAAAACRLKDCAEPLADETLLEHSFGQVGTIMHRFGGTVRPLHPYLLEALRDVAALVDKVTSVVRYRVRKVQAEEELAALAREGQLYDAEETLERFRLQDNAEAPLFLLQLDRDPTEEVPEPGEISAPAGDAAELWFEAFGDRWRILNYRTLGIHESNDGESILKIPLLETGATEGWLYLLGVSYTPWNHRRPISEEVQRTVRAMGKERIAADHVSPQYIKLVSRFNAAMVASGISWDDAYLVLVPRSWLLRKRSTELVELLTERILELTGGMSGNPAALPEHIAAVWEQEWTEECHSQTDGDKERWGMLRNMLLPR